MLINSPNISGSLNVSGNTVITGSLTTSIAALNTPATTFLTSDGGTIKSRTAAQTLSDIGAQASGSYLTISSATGSYVPYTGATGTVNLGYNPLAASRIRIDGNAPTAGSHLGFKQATNVDTGDGGYTSISTFGTNTMTFVFAQPTGFKRFSFNVFGITQDVSGGRVYSMPDESGTLALTSNLGSYLPLTGGGAITGSLIVTGGITGNVTGSATTASYVEYSNVANKPTLLSGSVQIRDFGIFATTGSNQFNGNQAITGSLTTTGTIVAQTLNVQQVTSSIVFSSGSNIFGNSLANTQQFTGSVGVTGSLTVAGAGAFTGALNGSSAIFTGAITNQQTNISADGAGVVLQGYVDNTLRIAVRGSGYNDGSRGGLLASTGDFGSNITATGNLNLQGAVTRNINFYDSSNTNINAQIQYDQISSTSGQLFFGTNNAGTFATRLTISNTGAATFSSTVTATRGFFSSNAASDSTTALLANASTNDSSTYAALFGSLNAGYRMVVRADGNVGIGINSPAVLLNIERNASGTGLGDGMLFKMKNTSTTTNTRSGINFGNIDGIGGSLAMQSAILKNAATGEYDMTWDFYGGAAGWQEGILYIDSNPGRIGIGTQSPITRLSLRNYGGARLPYINGTNNTFDDQGITVASANSGNAAIGGGLDLTNNTYSVNAYSPIISFSSLSLSAAYNNAYAGIWGVFRGAGGDSNWNTGDLVFGTALSYGINERMRIRNDGNVGIGTTSPQNRLTVNTPLRNDGETNTLGALVVAGAISSSPSYDFTNSTSIFRIQGSDATNNLQFGIGGEAYNFHPWIQGSFDNSTAGSPSFGPKDILLQPIGGRIGVGSLSPSNVVDIYDTSQNSPTVGILGARTRGGGTFITGRTVPRDTSNQTVTIATMSTSGTNERIFIKVQVVNVSAVNTYGNVHVGYAIWSVSGGSSVTTMTLDSGNSNIGNTNVGTLSWSGNNLQYTTNGAGNYELNSITIWGSARDTGVIT